MRLTEDLHRVDGVAGGNVYLITGAHPLLVDTGLPGQAGTILAYMERAGLSPRSLEAIVLTHHDVDHVGSAAELQRVTGAPIWAPVGDAAYIRRDATPAGFKRNAWRIARLVFGPCPPPRLDRELMDGDRLPGDLEVLATPGHTPGHISLFRPGLLLAGDVLRTGSRRRPARLRASAPFMSSDPGQVAASISRLAQLDTEIIGAGHGTPVTRGGREALGALARRMVGAAAHAPAPAGGKEG